MTKAVRAHSPLLVILAVGLLLRLGWWLSYVDIIENEGTSYVRLAWNWFHGRGYVSLWGEAHTIFPPLYPLLIALLSPIAGSGEAAARLVSLLAGTGLVAAVYALARQVFNQRAAMLAGCLAACHPILIGYSVAAYSETLFITLSAAGGLALLRWVTFPTGYWAAAAAGLSSLAYLTRPEGVALIGIFGVTILLLGWLGKPRRRGLVSMGAFLATTLVVTTPYVVHLSRRAGAFRWEGKSAINNAISLQMAQGISYAEAARGVGPDGEPQGVFLALDQYELLRTQRGGTGAILRSIAEAPVDHARKLASRVLWSRFLGSPLIVVLIALGIVGTAWWRARVREGIILLAILTQALVVPFSVQWTYPRFLLPLVPVGIVWAAAGADWIGHAVTAITERWNLARRGRTVAGWWASAILVLGVALYSFRPVLRTGELAQTRDGEFRAAGEWIKSDYRNSGQTSMPKIASIRLATAHYAAGEVVYLPYGDEGRALRFLRRSAPQYLVLHQSELSQTPYGEQWFRNGIADRCALPVVNLPSATAGLLRIWKWKCGPGSETTREASRKHDQ